jgi:hypothetical protein
LVELYADAQRGRTADQRFEKLVHMLPRKRDSAG